LWNLLKKAGFAKGSGRAVVPTPSAQHGVSKLSGSALSACHLLQGESIWRWRGMRKIYTGGWISVLPFILKWNFLRTVPPNCDQFLFLRTSLLVLQN
jgi:hypothetical protein